MANTRTATKATTRRKSPAKPLGDLGNEAEIARDVVDYLKEYAREKPEIAALWCFGLGFVLGWKLKIW